MILTSSLREKLVNQRRQLLREKEEFFSCVLESARELMPLEASSELFPFIVRTLLQPIYDSLTEDNALLESWLSSLPALYSDFLEKHNWLSNITVNEGADSKEGIHALARLLVTLRRRQRMLESAGETC